MDNIGKDEKLPLTKSQHIAYEKAMTADSLDVAYKILPIFEAIPEG